MTIPCGQRGACGLDRLLCGRVISAAYVEGLGARLKVFLGSLYQLDLDMEHVEMMIYGRRDGGHLHGCKLAAQLRNHSTPRSDWLTVDGVRAAELCGRPRLHRRGQLREHLLHHLLLEHELHVLWRTAALVGAQVDDGQPVVDNEREEPALQPLLLEALRDASDTLGAHLVEHRQQEHVAPIV